MQAMKRQEGTDHRQAPEEVFGVVLRKIRHERRMSQQVLADKSGYHRTYIGLIENGQKSPSLRTIWNFAATLEVKPSEILKQVEGLIMK